MPDIHAATEGDGREQRLREQLLALVACGMSARGIAAALRIGEDELRDRFARELACGLTEANVRVAQALFRKATGGGPQGVVAAIFWLKARAGWRDRPDPEPYPGLRQDAQPAAGASADGTPWEGLVE